MSDDEYLNSLSRDDKFYWAMAYSNGVREGEANSRREFWTGFLIGAAIVWVILL